MNMWTAIKRMNQRYDDLSKRAVERMITSIDHPGRRNGMRHLNLRDLLRNGLDAEKRK